MEAQKEADRDRMKTLLVEAIATLCRNGLNYEEELNVEGLIGITVDKKDVFLVSVRESFSLATPSEKLGLTQSQDNLEPDESVPSPKRVKKRPGDYFIF